MNGVNQSDFRSGISCGSAFQTNSSCSSSGTARKNHRYVTTAPRTPRNRLVRPTASTAPTIWAPHQAVTVSAIVISAPLMSADDVSASTKMLVSHSMALELRPGLRQAPALGDLGQRAVLAHLL